MAATTTSFAFFVTEVWHMDVLYFFNGLGIGLFFGAYMNLPNAFIAKFYPHAIAQARGVPFPFFNVGTMLGPLMLHHLGWAVAGALQFV